MAKNSSEYWEERIAQHTWEAYNVAEQKNARLIRMYRKASQDIENAIMQLAVSQKAADGVLMRTDIYDQNHLVKLQREILGILKHLGDDVETFASREMLTAYQDNYSQVMEVFGGIDFSMPDKKLFEKVINEPWRGGNFSRRLWQNQDKLGRVLNDVLAQGLTRGQTTTEMAIKISNEMQKGFNEAHRLVRTETMHYLNESSLQAYKDAGVQEVEFWAAEDERTCEHCGALHGKKYPSDKPPILPLHPNCRCTYLPVVKVTN